MILKQCSLATLQNNVDREDSEKINHKSMAKIGLKYGTCGLNIVQYIIQPVPIGILPTAL